MCAKQSSRLLLSCRQATLWIWVGPGLVAILNPTLVNVGTGASYRTVCGWMKWWDVDAWLQVPAELQFHHNVPYIVKEVFQKRMHKSSLLSCFFRSAFAGILKVCETEIAVVWMVNDHAVPVFRIFLRVLPISDFPSHRSNISFSVLFRALRWRPTTASTSTVYF